MSDKEIGEATKERLVRHLSKKHLATEGYQDTTEVKVEEKKKAVKTKLAGWKHFVAGGVAGVAEVACTMPLDVIKTQMQLNPGKYKGPVDAFTQIGKRSPAALYYGMPAFMTQTSAKAAIRFFSFAQCKEAIVLVVGEESAKQNSVAVNLAAGLGAGSVEAAIWTTPTERLKVLRQSEANSDGPKKYNSMVSTARVVMQEQGVRGLFVGLVPCVIRQASSVGFRFMTYEPVKNLITSVSGQKEETVSTFMVSGAVCGGISVVLNNPFDVIKNIQQAGTKGNLFTIASQVYQTSGFKGFFRGLSARVPRVAAGQGITFGVYENMAKLLMNV